VLPPTTRALLVDEQAPCQIAQVVGPFGATLRYHGIAFATGVRPTSARLSAGPKGALLHVETNELDLTGEVDPKTLGAVPLDEDVLAGGYLRVLHAPLVEVKGDRAVLQARGVSWLQAKAPLTIELACDRIALGERASNESGTLVALQDGLDEPFTRTSGGEEVARLVTAKAARRPKPSKSSGRKLSPLEQLVSRGALGVIREPVYELARTDKYVHIRIVGFTEEATGWVAATAVKTAGGGGGGGFGSLGRGSAKLERLTCPRAVPIYLRAGDEVLRVGQYKPSASITRDPEPAHETGQPNEAAVKLGGSGGFGLGGLGGGGGGPTTGEDGKTVQAFVQTTALEGCSSEAAPPR
jgi:hypothetical protein